MPVRHRPATATTARGASSYESSSARASAVTDHTPRTSWMNLSGAISNGLLKLWALGRPWMLELRPGSFPDAEAGGAADRCRRRAHLPEYVAPPR